jgi:hypothetical protein
MTEADKVAVNDFVEKAKCRYQGKLIDLFLFGSRALGGSLT